MRVEEFDSFKSHTREEGGSIWMLLFYCEGELVRAQPVAYQQYRLVWGVKLGLTLEMYKILTIVLLKKKKKVFQSYILLFSELLFQAFIKRHYYLVFSQPF